MFNENYYTTLANICGSYHPKFQKKLFIERALARIDSLELNDRMRFTADLLHEFVSLSYEDKLIFFAKVIDKMKPGYTTIIFPEYVAKYGIGNFESSLNALKLFTRYGTSEFAIRHFLLNDFEKTLNYMELFSQDANHHVRRLASEGTRPRLPWSFALPIMIREPWHSRNILNTLRQDEELYVRKSVANHLNDISKDNPEYLLHFLKEWDDANIFSNWIIRRGLRSLVKQGNKEALTLLHVSGDVSIRIDTFTCQPKVVNLNEYIELTVELTSCDNANHTIIIDYQIDYPNENGYKSSKVYKWKNIRLAPRASIAYSKRNLLKDFSTRKQKKGIHEIHLLVNGNKVATSYFELVRE